MQSYGIDLIKQHFILVGISLFLAILIALPIGIIVTRPPLNRKANHILSFLNTAQGIPSLAVVAIFLPIMGIGVRPAIFALTLYGLLPIARNTVAAIMGLDPGILEAARGMGMSKKHILFRVELPLALPIIIAGIQTSAILIVGTAVIAHLIGGGGLGRLIFSGISNNIPSLIIVGSLLTGAIAVILDQVIGLIHKRLSVRYLGQD